MDKRPKRKGTDNELLIRIDERTENLLKEIQSIKDGYVTRTEFSPIKLIVQGIVSVILLGVLGSIITLVLR